jgi:hypothetical protein
MYVDHLKNCFVNDTFVHQSRLLECLRQQGFSIEDASNILEAVISSGDLVASAANDGHYRLSRTSN